MGASTPFWASSPSWACERPTLAPPHPSLATPFLKASRSTRSLGERTPLAKSAFFTGPLLPHPVGNPRPSLLEPSWNRPRCAVCCVLCPSDPAAHERAPWRLPGCMALPCSGAALLQKPGRLWIRQLLWHSLGLLHFPHNDGQPQGRVRKPTTTPPRDLRLHWEQDAYHAGPRPHVLPSLRAGPPCFSLSLGPLGCLIDEGGIVAASSCDPDQLQSSPCAARIGW